MTVEGLSLHVVSAGEEAAPTVVFLHGWPESSRCWSPVMELAAQRAHAVAFDLPGIGESTGVATDGTKRELARVVHELLGTLGLRDVTLVGHDVGGMVAYAYLYAYDDLARVVIMDVAIPGLDPWDDVVRNPYLWHFAFHAIPELPERLVQSRQHEYFDYFFETIAANPEKITPEARAAYVDAYATDGALTAGFDWYRAFPEDAAKNREQTGARTTPVLYLRGEHESGDIGAYLTGIQNAGVTQLEHALVPGSGHFAPEEAPAETWRLIADFIGL